MQLFKSSTWGSILAALLFVFLSACSNNNAPYSDYSQRLSNVLEINLATAEITTVTARYPNFTTPKLDTVYSQKNRISIREFLGLRQCKLHTVIAQRNSQMGKVATASQLLKNDLAILDTGPHCLRVLEESDLKKTLSQYLSAKRQQLPTVLWNALLAQAEYRTLWRQRSHDASYPDTVSSASVVDDLVLLDTFVRRVLSGDYKVSEAQFSHIELALGRIRHGDAGQLLSELLQLQSALQIANTVVESRLTQKLCLQATPTPKAKHVQNVVNKFFITNVQARAVKLQQRHQALMPAIHSLEGLLLKYANTDYQQWVSQRNQLLKSGLRAAQQHANKLQALYKQCGLTVGITPHD